ncbi:MAG TPA: YbaK/EbsC family protein [Burkholderiales bacterium]|nr:YbaK/EbsC family protein [Burkholderiales bacterium]
MNLPGKLKNYLGLHQVHFELVAHPRTVSCVHTARVTRIAPERLAKSVVLCDERGYVMVVLPVTGHVDLDALGRRTGRALRMANEVEAERLFDDCEPGAFPAFGEPYGVETLIDESLLEQPEIYFEAGNHTDLVRMTPAQFVELAGSAPRGRFMTQH